MNILVTGKDGQLGKCMQDSSKLDEKNNYIFLGHNELDITDKECVDKIFNQINPDFVINCAAYTDVKKAETDIDNAYLINSDSVGNLVDCCKKHGSYFVHISTDFVFDGNRKTPYKEMDTTRPINKYGLSKLSGELIAENYGKSIIIRTSWLYSQYGKNFYRVMSERIHFAMSTNVVNDQIGVPTYARDLSDFIVFNVINNENISEKCGLYHFSNKGMTTWYDFAATIESLQKSSSKYEPNTSEIFIKPISSVKYGDKVKRPKYSVLDTTKVEETFGITIKHWTASLLRCMKNDDEI